MEKKCSKCAIPFTCQNETRGCWCEDVQLSTETLIHLKEHYENCLCPACLATYEVPYVAGQSREEGGTCGTVGTFERGLEGLAAT